MKKYVRLIVTSIFLSVLFRFFFLFLYRGRSVDYVVKQAKNKYKVHEEYVRGEKEISNHYYIELQFDEILFNFRVSDIFDKKSYIVDTIYSFKNQQYTCILPIFVDDSIQTDILCKKGEMIYPYQKLRNESLQLDKYATSMEAYGYSIGTSEEITSDYGIDVVKDNIVSSHTIVIPSYTGIYLISGKGKNIISSIQLFEDDVYIQPIQSVVSNYYIVADYDSSYSFHEFKLVDLNTKKVSFITSDNAISMDSYVQGVVDDSVYIIDRSNRRQYKINVSNKTVSLLGDSKKGILYYNGTDFENKSIYDALNSNLLFSSSHLESSKYDFVDAFDNIYYSYFRTKRGYDVHISYSENMSLYTYGFSVPSLDRVEYIEDYVYYVDGDTLYYYHPKGVAKVLKYAELFYNSKIKFWIYKK